MEGITEWTFEGRPEPELLSTKYGLTASATVTSAAYMLVYEKWTICQFEWHRGLSEFVSSLQVLQAWDFFILETRKVSGSRPTLKIKKTLCGGKKL